MKCNICVECNKEFSGRKKKYCSDECFKEKRRRYNRELWRKNNTPKPDVTIVCEWCGDEHKVPSRTAHQARFCSERCNSTWWSREVYGHSPEEERLALRREQKKLRLLRLDRIRALKSLNRTITKVIRFKEEEQKAIDSTKDCVECGSEFYNVMPNALTCSLRCRRRRSNRLRKLYEKDRYNERNLIDKDITLDRLYVIDNGICYLCNDPCNYNDMDITSEGHYIVGETYPSIDHVIPIAKGGMHSWDNVKLSHHRCNTLKRDNYNALETV